MIPLYLIPAFILKKLNFRLFNINYWQIGTYTQQFDLFYKLNDKDYKIFCCIPKNLSSSNFFTSIVKTKFIVIENYFLCLLILPFYYFNFLKLNHIATDEGFSNNKCLYEWIGFQAKTSIDLGTKHFCEWYKTFYK